MREKYFECNVHCISYLHLSFHLPCLQDFYFKCIFPYKEKNLFTSMRVRSLLLNDAHCKFSSLSRFDNFVMCWPSRFRVVTFENQRNEMKLKNSFDMDSTGILLSYIKALKTSFENFLINLCLIISAK